jgi:hypothetical protein
MAAGFGDDLDAALHEPLPLPISFEGFEQQAGVLASYFLVPRLYLWVIEGRIRSAASR